MMSLNDEIVGNYDSKRKLIYHFLNLPFHEIIKIATNLDLILDEDRNVENIELYRRVINRAENENKLAELWEEIEQLFSSKEKEKDYENASDAGV